VVNKEHIREKAFELGAELVGFAPVSRWREEGGLPEQYHPDRIWHKARTVISLALPVWLPVVETQPSAWGRDQYGIVNSLLDEIAYRLAAFLNRCGIASINIGRDGYGDIDALIRKPAAAFSHVWAAHYAGIGKVGWNHTLLTRQYGPRVRLVSLLSSIETEGDPLIDEELCLRCFLCREICPVDAFSGRKETYAAMDRVTCATNSKRLRSSFRNPCGFCIKVCPVGEDRKLFGSSDVRKYLRERDYDASVADRREFDGWRHVRGHGGFPLEEDE